MSKIFIGNNKWFDDNGLERNKNGTINWIANVGKTIEFRCLDYYGSYTIKKVIPSNDKWYKYSYAIYFNNDIEKEFIVNCQNLSKVNFSYLLRLYSIDFLYNVGDIINNQFLVLKRERKKLFPSDVSRIKTYTCKCLNDGYIFENSEKNLKNQKKCEVCLGKVVIKGINDIATTRPELVRFLKNKDDAYKYTAYSCKNLDFVCDICGKDFKVSPNNFGFNFPCKCYSSDSYPNRLIREVFDQLNIPYIRELRKRHFVWCDKYKYDLYFKINDTAYIIEMDGFFHKDEKIEIDRIKDELAMANGIKVIRIDCNYKKIENRLSYIKNNILNSELSSVINLSKVNWDIIDLKLLENNITKSVCDLRNQGLTNSKIANMLNVSISVVDSHIKIGKNNGLLNEWAMSNQYTKTKVVEIINLENGQTQYCIGSHNFLNNSEKYIGIKTNHNMLKKCTINKHIILNKYEIKVMSYYDYLIKTMSL